MKPINIIALLSIVLLASCQGIRQVSQVQTVRSSDSIVVREVVRVDTLRIPGAQTTIEVPVEVLRRDTVLVARHGHATARLHIRDGMLTATAWCDSLVQLVLSHEREIYRLTKEAGHSSHISLTEQKARGPGGLLRILYTLGVLGIITIVIIILLKIR